MQVIGMLDSPYVRRVAVSLQLLGLPFEHKPLSVFSTFEAFSRINPVVKAPTLVCDDGTVLLDSNLILDYAETLAAERGGARRLLPAALAERQPALRRIGLALAACEKSVQIVYEHMRPAERQHAPWVERVTGQLNAALAALEADWQQAPPAGPGAATIDQAGVTAAVVWHFIQQMLPEQVPSASYPSLAAWSARAEQLDAFCAAPYGSGRVAGAGA